MLYLNLVNEKINSNKENINQINNSQNNTNTNNTETAVFGGGCFWCLEAVFKNVIGVINVESGYAGGFTQNPTYKQVCSGSTNHAEVVKIEFAPSVISYEVLLNIFFEVHDPTKLNRQGNDIGTQYRLIILYNSDIQKEIAQKVINKLTDEKIYPSPIVTEIKPLGNFFKAEDYHQAYFENNQNQPYCQFVLSTKIAKFKKNFSKYLKKNIL